jgi:hypothetical protein
MKYPLKTEVEAAGSAGNKNREPITGAIQGNKIICASLR